jgi:mersacidin/lichenicidin family type 2 lantibiotic
MPDDSALLLGLSVESVPRRKTMNAETIIRAWKDPEFRAHLTPEQRQALPDNPSGKPASELGDDELVDVVGGLRPIQPTPPILLTQKPCHY